MPIILTLEKMEGVLQLTLYAKDSDKDLVVFNAILDTLILTESASSLKILKKFVMEDAIKTEKIAKMEILRFH